MNIAKYRAQRSERGDIVKEISRKLSTTAKSRSTNYKPVLLLIGSSICLLVGAMDELIAMKLDEVEDKEKMN